MNLDTWEIKIDSAAIQNDVSQGQNWLSNLGR